MIASKLLIHLVMTGAQLVASGADAYYTHQSLLNPRVFERNPIARPFVNTTRGQVIFFSTQTVIKLGAAEFLRRKHHTVFEYSFRTYGILDNASCAFVSSKNVTK